jgi:hypothetical protein
MSKPLTFYEAPLFAKILKHHLYVFKRFHYTTRKTLKLKVKLNYCERLPLVDTLTANSFADRRCRVVCVTDPLRP